MKKFSEVAVIGAGIMGRGIAQLCAQRGFYVYLVDLDDGILSQGIGEIQSAIQRMADKGKISSEESGEVLKRIKGVTDLDAAATDADLVIEAVPENMELKSRVFRDIDKICRPNVILATNTSSLSIAQIARATGRPDKVIGLHFFYPVPVIEGVEVIPSLLTSEETVNSTMNFVKAIGKEPLISRDFPGFIVNRLLPALINEAFNLLWQGIAPAKEIDKACTLTLRHPVGPLAMADLIGLDTVLSVLEYLHGELGEKYRPSPLLKQLVKAGHYGRKSGKGVYGYESTIRNKSAKTDTVV